MQLSIEWFSSSRRRHRFKILKTQLHLPEWTKEARHINALHFLSYQVPFAVAVLLADSFFYLNALRFPPKKINQFLVLLHASWNLFVCAIIFRAKRSSPLSYFYRNIIHNDFKVCWVMKLFQAEKIVNETQMKSYLMTTLREDIFEKLKFLTDRRTLFANLQFQPFFQLIWRISWEKSSLVRILVTAIWRFRQASAISIQSACSCLKLLHQKEGKDGNINNC